MKTAGIITEYNPLHYGHLHLLQAVRQRFGEDTAVICAMSIGKPNVLTEEQMAEVMVKFQSYGQPGEKKTGY